MPKHEQYLLTQDGGSAADDEIEGEPQQPGVMPTA